MENGWWFLKKWLEQLIDRPNVSIFVCQLFGESTSYFSSNTLGVCVGGRFHRWKYAPTAWTSCQTYPRWHKVESIIWALCLENSLFISTYVPNVRPNNHKLSLWTNKWVHLHHKMSHLSWWNGVESGSCLWTTWLLPLCLWKRNLGTWCCLWRRWH